MAVWWGILGAFTMEVGLAFFVLLCVATPNVTFATAWAEFIILLAFVIFTMIGYLLIAEAVDRANEHARLCGASKGPRKMVEGDI